MELADWIEVGVSTIQVRLKAKKMAEARAYQYRTLQEIPHGVSDSCVETIEVCIQK